MKLDLREQGTIVDGGARWELEQAVTSAFKSLDPYMDDDNRDAPPDFTKSEHLDKQLNEISDGFMDALKDAVKDASDQVKNGLDHEMNKLAEDNKFHVDKDKLLNAQ